MPGRPRFDADAVRALVREWVEGGSLRAIADEVGISRGGLESFLKGRQPYTNTRLRLAAWQLRQRTLGGTVERDEVDAAIAVLERYIGTAATKAIRARRVREVTDKIAGGT
jgi:hypothetical protein